MLVRIPMMATTTRSSISVKPFLVFEVVWEIMNLNGKTTEKTWRYWKERSDETEA
jgi:hypothetical protein